QMSLEYYNGMDCVATWLVAQEEMKRLKAEGLWEAFFRFGQPLLPILEEWRRVGLRVDLERAVLFKRFTERRLHLAEKAIAELMGVLFNPYSPKQVAEFLYEKCKLPVQYNETHKGERRPSVDYEARKKLREYIAKHPRPEWEQAGRLLELLDFLHGEKKKLEYFGRISPDGRIHPYFKAHGEETFRLSSTPNVQNWSKADITVWGGSRRHATGRSPIGEENLPKMGSLRSIVLPDDDDSVILSCDFSQIQLWIYAKIWNVKWLLAAYEKGDYLYGLVYEALYKRPFFQEGKPRTKKNMRPEVTESEILRTKAVPLGFMFGRSGRSVAEEYGWPPEEGEALRKWWFSLNPEIPASHDRIAYEVRQKGYVRHVFGQKLYYPAGGVTEAINSYAQSNEAFIVNESTILIHEELKRRGLRARVMLSLHDQLLFSVDERQLIEVYEEVVKPILERPIKELGGFVFRHNAEVSPAWDWETLDYAEWKRQFECSGPICCARARREKAQQGLPGLP
ncbi:MAG: DNA polymerase, partial [candidate division WOR-3 bacterium]